MYSVQHNFYDNLFNKILNKLCDHITLLTYNEILNAILLFKYAPKYCEIVILQSQVGGW